MLRARITLFLVLLNAYSAFADLKSADDLYEESQKLNSELKIEKDFVTKSKSLLKLKASMHNTLKAYEKKDPLKGGPKEKEVSFLFYTLEPVFNLASKKSITVSDCDKTKQMVIASDSMGRGENPPLTRSAKEALQWIEILCK